MPIDSLIPQGPSNSLIPPTPAPLASPAALPPRPQAQPVNPADLRNFTDPLAIRRNIYQSVFDAASQIQPYSDGTHSISLHDLEWADPERFTRKQRKDAVLRGETLGRRLRGTWRMTDAANNVIEQRPMVVARVPYMSSLGTFTNRGTDYSLVNQPRLMAGVYARRQANGELESHVNIMPGKGASHRFFLDPAKSVFKMRLGQSEVPLMPLLRAMGTTDKELAEAWSPEFVTANYAHNDSGVIPKLQQRLLSFKDLQDTAASPESLRQKLIAKYTSMELDPTVTQRTLGKPFTHLTKEAVLAATRKLMQISRGEADVDDRDHLAYQTFFGPEDLFRERIARDHGQIQKTAFRKALWKGSLANMPSGLFTQQLDNALLGSGLGQAIEEINPAEVFDKLSRVTRLGEGGIPSTQSIPEEARSVQPSHMAFMDPSRTPESMAAGVDLYMASGARKGPNGKIYSPMIDSKTGQQVWKSPQDLADAAVATPDVMKWTTPRVPVLKGGKMDYVPKSEIDYVVPHFEQVFSPLGNLIPLKTATKAQRVAMGARYITQALSMVNAQAPLVRGQMPGTEASWEEHYSPQMGAVRASAGGRVTDVRDGSIHVRYDDGKTDEIELYQNHPFSRKTLINQTPTIQPGQTFAPGQLLARSNFTDDKGVMAMGLNARVAYVPWKGFNHEDAIVISESFAKRSASEHAYQHELELTDKHKMGKKNYISLFAQKYDRKTLENIDDNGMVKPGSVVNFGDPLILAARQRDNAQNKIHKQRQAGYVDETLTWKHHDPGEVTDVVMGKNGPVVVVKTHATTQIGDKLSGRYGDKGVVAAIVPDAKMFRDQDGNPFEVLLSPLGIQTRANPSQALEAVLGKIAEKTGKPINVPDFSDEEDMTEWVRKQAHAVGVDPYSAAIHDPERDRKIPGVLSGNRFLMKLHHTSESKAQGRGSGGYTAEGSPSKGGETGCFIGSQLVECVVAGSTVYESIGDLVRLHSGLTVASCEPPTRYRERAARVNAKIKNWFSRSVPPDELIEIVLENGEVLTSTRTHTFLLADGQKRCASELTLDSELLE